MIDQSLSSTLLACPELAFWLEEMRSAATIGQPSIIVAIPVKNEEARIGDCLASLRDQRTIAGVPLETGSFGVVLLLNNCTDRTLDIVRACASKCNFPLYFRSWQLASHDAHAGVARRLAMDAAAAWLLSGDRHKGVILTTDADSYVARDWISRQCRAFASGADAVAGFVLDDPVEFRRLPARLRRRGCREARYTWLLTEMRSCLDPDVFDPWPRHLMASGANLGVTLRAYLDIGGLPCLPLGEDRAMIALLEAKGARIRHCLQTKVTTSCRLVGRAAGGMADTMQDRIANPEALCDHELEPAVNAQHRYFWRGELRRLHNSGSIWRAREWLEDLALPSTYLPEFATMNFGALWRTVSRLSSRLRYEALRPDQLPSEIQHAVKIVRQLRGIAKSADARLINAGDAAEFKIAI